MDKVVSGIPLPQGSGKGQPRKYPIYEMKAGESFFVDGQTTQGSAASAARMHARNANKQFITRNDGSGVRIWRVS